MSGIKSTVLPSWAVVVKLMAVYDALPCFWNPVKTSYFFNHKTPQFSVITTSQWYKVQTMQNLWSISSFLSQMEGERLLFIIFQYVFKMFSLLTVPSQVIPEGSESPFLAVGLRRCRAWNPITSAAMLVLWHQTPSMQNTTAGVYQQLALQIGGCHRWVHPWVTFLTRDGEMTLLMGREAEKAFCWGWSWHEITLEHWGKMEETGTLILWLEGSKEGSEKLAFLNFSKFFSNNFIFFLNVCSIHHQYIKKGNPCFSLL